MKQNRNQNNQKGFTMAELLIVVAIIAVLVAIAIPIFNKQIEKSREAYDIATMRQAASAAVDLYYAGVKDGPSAVNAGLKWHSGTAEKANAAGVYDPGTGKIYSKDDPNYPASLKKRGYGKGTTINAGTTFVMGNESFGAYAPGEKYTDAVVMVSIYPNAATPHVDVYWKNNISGDNTYVGRDHGSNIPKYCIRINLN